MIRALIISVCCAAYITAQDVETTTTHKPHTHRPHPSHEPIEQDTYRFVYEPHSHQMIIVSGHACYVFTLTDAERLSVHSDAGLQTVELRLLTALANNAVVKTTKEDLNHNVAHVCGHRSTEFYKEASTTNP